MYPNYAQPLGTRLLINPLFSSFSSSFSSFSPNSPNSLSTPISHTTHTLMAHIGRWGSNFSVKKNRNSLAYLPFGVWFIVNEFDRFVSSTRMFITIQLYVPQHWLLSSDLIVLIGKSIPSRKISKIHFSSANQLIEGKICHSLSIYDDFSHYSSAVWQKFIHFGRDECSMFNAQRFCRCHHVHLEPFCGVFSISLFLSISLKSLSLPQNSVKSRSQLH